MQKDFKLCIIFKTKELQTQVESKVKDLYDKKSMTDSIEEASAAIVILDTICTEDNTEKLITTKYKIPYKKIYLSNCDELKDIVNDFYAFNRQLYEELK